MPAFLDSLLGICRFRRGPEDMPYSPPLLIALLIACGALQAFFNVYNGAAPGVAAAVLVGGLGLIGALHLLLRGRGKSLRFVQTMTALAAVYLLFGVVIDALISWLSLAALSKQVLEHPEHPPALTTLQTLMIPGVLGLVIWQFCVFVGIVRRALEIPVAGAVLVLLLLFLVDWFVASLVASAMGVV
ncbi:MAG: hypothetical protein KJS83_06060 [Xanthomonadaceae bacterium]|nr:hypothetical protein [Xanthomonadaceae bacterium]MDE2054497.1 hypothetical protein [Xanthomonadaceae bacterium]